MQVCEVEGCRCQGQRHHIVFRSHGGPDIKWNYKYLCAEHHNMGNRSPHRCHEVDKAYKIELQREYFTLFRGQRYTVEGVAEVLGCRVRDIESLFKSLIGYGGTYDKEDVIRALMGGNIY